MAGRLSMWGAGQLLGSFWGQSVAPPDAFYIALINTVAPSSYVSGAELGEPQVQSYTRAKIPNTGAYWSNDSQPQLILTDADVVFAEAFQNWGVLRYWAMCNAEVDGMVYATGSLSSPYQVNLGDTAVLGAGDLSVALGPFYAEEG